MQWFETSPSFVNVSAWAISSAGFIKLLGCPAQNLILGLVIFFSLFFLSQSLYLLHGGFGSSWLFHAVLGWAVLPPLSGQNSEKIVHFCACQ